MPWLVDAIACTGIIIGKKHFLTAMHCYDTYEKMNRREWVHIGSHYKEKPNQPFIGQKVQIDRNRVFGIGPRGRSITPYPKAQDYHVPDIVLVTLLEEIQFSQTIQKAFLVSPSSPGDDCKECTGICQNYSGYLFRATGWGRVSNSKVIIYILI